MEKIKLKVRSGDPGECVDQSAAVTTRALVTMTTSAARYLLLMVDCSNPGECVDHVNAQLGHNSGTSREFVAHVCAVQHRTRRPTHCWLKSDSSALKSILQAYKQEMLISVNFNSNV